MIIRHHFSPLYEKIGYGKIEKVINMGKKLFKYISILALIILLLVVTSIITSYIRINQYKSSTLNHEIYQQDQLEQLFEDINSDQVTLFIYDVDNEDCLFIDEILLQQISYQYNGIRFDDIYKIQYENTYRSYIQQILKNTYHVDKIPAIVTIQKKDQGFEKIDAFEYSGIPETDHKNLEKFLERNEMLTASHKD